MTIVEGIADYKGTHCHFCSLNPDKDETGFFSNRYKLIPLTTEIFDLEMKSWSYWLYWIDMSRKGIFIPHSNEYEKARKEVSYKQLSFDNPYFTQHEKEQAEQNYQRKLVIDNYLKTALPLPYQVKAKFQGSTDFSSETEKMFVEWTDLPGRKIIE